MSIYTSSTTTTDTNNVTLLRNRTHFILVVEWEHANEPQLTVELQNFPLAIKARVTDGLMHYRLEINLNLAGYEVTSMNNAHFNVLDGKIRVHIPREDMKPKAPETVTLPCK